MVPVESHYFEHRGFGVQYPMRRNKGTALSNERGFLKAAQEQLSNYNEAIRTPRDASPVGMIDVQRFEEEMEKASFDDLASHMDRYFRSVLWAMGQGIKGEARWVEKSVEHIEFVPLLKDIFPNARFVHILRDPYATLVSMRNFRGGKKGFPYLPPLVDTLYHHRVFFDRWTNAFQGHSILTYEELLRSPEATMERVAGELGLSYDPILLQPTYLGDEWKGNPSLGEGMKGMDEQQAEHWKKEITPVEVKLLNRAMGNLFKCGNYERMSVPKGYWRRERGEKWKTWFSNRMYKNYLSTD